MSVDELLMGSVVVKHSSDESELGEGLREHVPEGEDSGRGESSTELWALPCTEQSGEGGHWITDGLFELSSAFGLFRRHRLACARSFFFSKGEIIPVGPKGAGG